MSNVPAWSGATAEYGANAGMFTQFLGTHNVSYLYSGASVISSEAIGNGVYLGTQNQWISQTFVTGSSQTGIGSVKLQISAVGGSPTLPLIPVLTVGIFEDGSGLPAGTALASVTVNNNYVYSAPFWVSFPVPLTVTPSTQYHIVTNLVGSASHYYAWQQSNQNAGAATSPDGSVWTFQNYGMMYEILDQSSGGNLTTITEDNGAKVTTLAYNSLDQITSVTEFVTTQGGGYIQSSGTLSYTNGFLTGVS